MGMCEWLYPLCSDYILFGDIYRDILSLACITPSKAKMLHHYNPEESNLDAIDETLRTNLSIWRQEWAEGRTATPHPPPHKINDFKALLDHNNYASKGLAQKKKVSKGLKRNNHLSKGQPDQTIDQLKPYMDGLIQLLQGFEENGVSKPDQILPGFYRPESKKPGWLYQEEFSPEDEQLKDKLLAMLKDSMAEFNWKTKILKEAFAKNVVFEGLTPFVDQVHKKMAALYKKTGEEQHPTHLLRAYKEISKRNLSMGALIHMLNPKSASKPRPRTAALSDNRISWAYYDYNAAY